MLKNINISNRVLVPVITVTAIFSLILFYAVDRMINRMIDKGHDDLIRSKVYDITVGKNRMVLNQRVG